jgi:hypothetical protein
MSGRSLNGERTSIEPITTTLHSSTSTRTEPDSDGPKSSSNVGTTNPFDLLDFTPGWFPTTSGGFPSIH